MVCADKIFLFLLTVALCWRVTEGEPVKRDLNGQQQSLELVHLGNFGPISRLSSHPSFAHLGLTAQQTVGLINVLLQNGFLNARALRFSNGQPFLADIYGPPVFPGNFYGIPGPAIDPYIFYLFSNYASGLNEETSGKLCFVSLVFRHGDRAPVAAYPKDPYSDASCWPNGWGQLTKLGKLQQYELGRWIRHHYWDFLPLKYNASDIYVQSTDVDRTLTSAYCNLAGLYECWNEEESDGLAWQPIPVHTTPLKMDSVLAAHKKCPAYDRLVPEAMKIEEVFLTNEFYQEVYSNLSIHTGLNINSMRDCVFLYSTLTIQSFYGFQLPEWTKNYFPDPLKEITEFAFKFPCFTTPMKRLKCGPLLKDIIQHMEAKKEGKITQKMWMYSAHDTTIVNLMQCLGVFEGDLPPYTATLLIELFKQENDYFVSVSYKTPTTFRILRLPCCERSCPFQDFKRILRPVIPVDWEKECC